MGMGWILSQGTLVHDDRTITKIDIATSGRGINCTQPREYNIILEYADLGYLGEADSYTLIADIVLG